MIPAPCRLSTTVCASSVNTRPSESLPIRRIGTDLNKRPLRRIFFDVILATWGRGQESNDFRIPENRRDGAEFARPLRKKNKCHGEKRCFIGNNFAGNQSGKRNPRGIHENARIEAPTAQGTFLATETIVQG